jgi:hypothetical protein
MEDSIPSIDHRNEAVRAFKRFYTSRTGAVRKVSFSKVDFSGLPKSSSTVRRGGDLAGGCPSRQTVGLPFRGSGTNGTESLMRQEPKAGWFSPSRVDYSATGWFPDVRQPQHYTESSNIESSRCPAIQEFRSHRSDVPCIDLVA